MLNPVPVRVLPSKSGLPRLARLGLAAMLLLALGACNSSYRLGGTVSGLTSNGLVIANGSDTVTVAANATTFYMPKLLEEGASYSLTVQTQPTGLKCAFTGANGASPASGKMPASYVIDTAVVCTPSTYTLGGTVSGLTTSGLVVTNGTDTVAVPASGTTFTLPTKVASGSSYTLTVQTQPSGATCTFSSGSGATASSGTMPSADVVAALVCVPNPYTLGGSVMGLTTGGLVIANGGDTIFVAANATTFTLPTKVLAFSSYALSVQTQPTGLTCAFSTGGNAAASSGTMPTADLTSTVLICSPNPYTLGGTVTGLTAAGLVIANGSDTVTVAANATTFTLPQQVDAGSSYSLTVQSQPTGLVCSFSSGSNVAPSSGTMPPSNLTNTALTCSVAAYALGGTISGLVGSVVITNGSDSLTLSSNGSFQFSHTVPYHGSYSVQVQTQPVNQVCTVANGTGTMQAGAVTNVTIVCGDIHTISGVITGLTTNQLVLLNNGTDATMINSNATSFTMTTPVADGSSYNITVGTQPYGYFACTPSNNTGTATADVNNVTISCVSHVGSASVLSDPALSGPVGVVVDSSGNLLVANPSGAGTVVRFPYANGTYGSAQVIVSGLSAAGLALDSHDNLYVTDAASSVYILAYSNGAYGAPTAINPNGTFTAPSGIAVDRNGNLFVSNYINNTISVVPYDNGNYGSAIAYSDPSLNAPSGIAVDDAGFVLVANAAGNSVSVLPIHSDLSLGTAAVFSDATFNGPTGLTLDSAGNLYVSNQVNNTVSLLSYANGLIGSGSLFGGSYNTSYALTTDHQGQLIATNYGNNTVTVIAK